MLLKGSPVCLRLREDLSLVHVRRSGLPPEQPSRLEPSLEEIAVPILREVGQACPHWLRPDAERVLFQHRVGPQGRREHFEVLLD